MDLFFVKLQDDLALVLSFILLTVNCNSYPNWTSLNLFNISNTNIGSKVQLETNIGDKYYMVIFHQIFCIQATHYKIIKSYIRTRGVSQETEIIKKYYFSLNPTVACTYEQNRPNKQSEL